MLHIQKIIGILQLNDKNVEIFKLFIRCNAVQSCSIAFRSLFGE